MNARAALREGTAREHERVDACFSRFRLDTRDGYRRFLAAQAAAHLPVEAALDEAGSVDLIADWPARRRAPLLQADLADLDASADPLLASPPLDSAAAILGALYVIEGSRLGGAVLKRSIPEGLPRRFLDAEQAPGAWRKLLEKLDDHLYDAARVEAAIRTAKEVFGRFEAAGDAAWRLLVVE